MVQAIEIQTADGACDSQLFTPAGNGPWPGVILCMDAVGPRPNLGAIAARVAAAGFAVLLPNLFYRQKKAPIVTGISFPAGAADIPAILGQIMPLVEKFDPEEGLGDSAYFIQYLHGHPSVRPSPLGIFGYCMGGGMALRAAARYPDTFGAVASFHAGGLATSAANSPHLLLPLITAALYAGHADADPHMNRGEIEIFERALESMPGHHESETYAGAHHHFTMADLPAYDAAAAAKSEAKLISLLAENI